ncbi:hypothetical protein OSB04_026516, partial [Centaurea solstitialis]
MEEVVVVEDEMEVADSSYRWRQRPRLVVYNHHHQLHCPAASSPPTTTIDRCHRQPPSNTTTSKEKMKSISIFSTEQVFRSREDLINWVQNVARSQGFIIVTRRSRSTRSSNKISKIVLGCDRGGVPKNKDAETKKINCPFELVGKYLKWHDGWTLRVVRDKHNHEPAMFMEGHSHMMGLSENEIRMVQNLTNLNVKPRDILSTLKDQNPNNVASLRTIYNARRKFRISEQEGRTPMQNVMHILQTKGYNFEYRLNNDTNGLEELFFMHPTSLIMWQAFPHVVLMDATYNTNMYNLPFLEIVGVTSTNKTFSIAFAFMRDEKACNYRWAMTCLKLTINASFCPRVIVTDRDLALMKACGEVFPQSNASNHTELGVLFIKSGKKLVESPSENAYMQNYAKLQTLLVDYPAVFGYLYNTWLSKYAEKFVSAWTDKHISFGNSTTNRVESQHAKLKKHLESRKADLDRFICVIENVVQSQDTAIKESLERCRIIRKPKFNKPLFQQLQGFVSEHAMDKILEEFNRSKGLMLTLESCGCQLRTSFGLPCAHELVMYLILFGESLICRLPYAWNMEILIVIMIYRGRPKKKNVRHKTQVPHRRSCSDLHQEPPIFMNLNEEPSRHSSFMEFDVLANNEQARHSSYFVQKEYVHPYIDQFPSIFHPYIMQVEDVKGDGNCGFRAIAVWLGRHEDEWPSVRHDLMEELIMYKTEYLEVYGIETWHQVYNSLNFFELDTFAPNEHWMDVFETGLLIASRYNVILHSLTTTGSLTFFPLRSSPPPWYEHVAFTIGYVNGNHFVKISLVEGHPMPRIVPNWFRFKYECATAWATPYMTRINKYEQLLYGNRTSDPTADPIANSIPIKKKEICAAVPSQRSRTVTGPDGNQDVFCSSSQLKYDVCGHFLQIPVNGKRAVACTRKEHLDWGIMKQDSLPVVPPNCSSDNLATVRDFIEKGKAALVSVGILRDTVVGNGKDSGKFSGRIVDSDMHDVGRFMNRLLGLPPEIENRCASLVKGLSEILKIDMDRGVPEDNRELSDWRNAFGSNTYPDGVCKEVSGSPTEKAVLQWGTKIGLKFDVRLQATLQWGTKIGLKFDVRLQATLLHVCLFNSSKKRGAVALRGVVSHLGSISPTLKFCKLRIFDCFFNHKGDGVLAKDQVDMMDIPSTP